MAGKTTPEIAKDQEGLTGKISDNFQNLELLQESFELLKQNFSTDHPFFYHSLRTGLILKEIGSDENTIISGVLHHVSTEHLILRKATEKTRREIKFNLEKIAQLRNLLTPKRNLKPRPIKEWASLLLSQQAEDLRKMFFAITQDIKPISISLAGWLDEMKNLALNYPKDEQVRNAVLALEILSPLAYGVGMTEMKNQIEDAVFPYLYPKEYKWLIENVKEKYNERKKYLVDVKKATIKILGQEGIKAFQIQARAKHYFSLYRKLLRHNMDLDKIYDLVALRIIVPDIETCYKALGAIHKHWRPLPGRIKDYINFPKPNGYRSLHTTVISKKGKIVEFQIKTPQMHQESEYGAIAHLSYEGKIAPKKYQEHFYWIEKLRKWQEEIKDPQKVSEYLKNELFKDQILVVTPKGDIITLPKDATAVDFAYAVHSDIGDHIEGAKVNGKITNIDKALKNGDTIEILTNDHKTPSTKWLRFVKTDKARSKIRSFLEKAYGFSFGEEKKKPVEEIKDRIAFLRKVLPVGRKKEAKVLVAGEEGIKTKLAQCCSPKLGDKIAAFITQGEGASIHKINCSNLKELQKKWPEKTVEASWQ